MQWLNVTQSWHACRRDNKDLNKWYRRPVSCNRHKTFQISFLLVFLLLYLDGQNIKMAKATTSKSAWKNKNWLQVRFVLSGFAVFWFLEKELGFNPHPRHHLLFIFCRECNMWGGAGTALLQLARDHKGCCIKKWCQRIRAWFWERKAKPLCSSLASV